MSQILSQIPRQLLQQQQRLTPQLIQAMNILQLPLMALESRIAQEIDGNPALEQIPSEEEYSDGSASEAEQEDERSEGEETLVIEEDGAHDFERLDNLVREYDWIDDESGYRGTKSRARSLEEGDIKMEAMANTAARPISLQEYLTQQWNLIEQDERARAIGARIIDFIDENGRLSTSLENIASELVPPLGLDELETVLRLVQQLDPPGIGARNLPECLLLQLEALPGTTELERKIIADQYDDLRKNRLPAIAKALGVDQADVNAALDVIARLSLRPGLDVVERQVPPIVPDIIVEFDEEEDQYEVRLVRSNTRELRISPEFRAALEKTRNDKKSREFIKQKIEAANTIIDAVRYRRERLLEVAKAVVEAQRDFLDQGEQHMKVLRMSDLATRFDCDPSTISRTVDEKYIQTPRGMFALRRFFTGGTESGNGEVLGWDSIKAKVREIVATEDKRDPLHDDEIVAQLKEFGIGIKRRTVAKYRAQLDIPTARQRRQY